MSDIRKRKGIKGITYQVRYATASSKTGYSYKTFSTLKDARAFRDNSGERQSFRAIGEIQTVPQAVQKWLDVCEKEGRNGRDPVTAYTLKHYEWRADIIRSYEWAKPLHELKAPDIVEFRSWLVRTYSRDVARKVLSSMHSVVLELVSRGSLAHDIVAGVSLRGTSRYDEPVTIPSEADVRALLAAADRLASSKNKQTARVWARYRPMLYLAADSGMRPQEYLVVASGSLRDGGVKVERALERGEQKISVTKTPAGRRFIELSEATFEMVTHYAKHHAVTNRHDLVFPTREGSWQNTDNWRKRGFAAACFEAGLIEEKEEDGEIIQRARYTPYDLRHFFASMLIEQRVNLKKIQKLMGHEDITTTLNVYGHVVERVEEAVEKRAGLLTSMTKTARGKSVAHAR